MEKGTSRYDFKDLDFGGLFWVSGRPTVITKMPQEGSAMIMESEVTVREIGTGRCYTVGLKTEQGTKG